MNYQTIKEGKIFATIYKRSRAYHTDFVTLLVQNHTHDIQSAFVVSKKVGNAVNRNLIKRRFRSIFNDIAPTLPKSSYLWIAKPGITAISYDKIYNDIKFLSSLALKSIEKGSKC